MSKKMKKIIAAVISITFVLSSVGIVYAADTHEKTDTAENTVSISAENTINTSSSGKDETVYVFAGADGSTNKIIVSVKSTEHMLKLVKNILSCMQIIRKKFMQKALQLF